MCCSDSPAADSPEIAQLGKSVPFPARMSAFPGDLNRSTQHLDSKYRAEDVADEAKTKDLLQHRAEELDVGSLASR